MTIINAGYHPDDTFSRIADSNLKELILYHRWGNVYVPLCQPIEEIRILTNLNKCYQDIPVILKNNLTGFLTNQKIIRLTSAEVDCASTNRELNLDDNILIRMVKGKISLEPIQRPVLFHFQPHRWADDDDLDFNHDMRLAGDSDLVSPHEKVDTILDNGFKFAIQKTQWDANDPTDFNFTAPLGFPSVADFVHKVTLFVGQVCVTILVLVLAGIGIKLYISHRRRLQQLRQDSERRRSDLYDLNNRLQALQDIGPNQPSQVSLHPHTQRASFRNSTSALATFQPHAPVTRHSVPLELRPLTETPMDPDASSIRFNPVPVALIKSMEK